MNGAVAPVDFEFDTANALSLKVIFEINNKYSSDGDVYINNFRIYTTDYKN